jgi:hypothetical protein
MGVSAGFVRAHTGAVEPSFRPPLSVHEVGGRCRLSLAGLAHGHGGTLQEAADDLVERLQRVVVSLRRTGIRFCGELGPPDRATLEYLWQLGELAARGEDIRAFVLGPAASVD